MALALLNILAGLQAGPEERGRVFGVLTLANPVALLVGGLASGPIVDQWGFPALFTACAFFLALLPAAALFLHDPPGPHRKGAREPDARAGGGRGAGLGWAFWVLFGAAVLAMIGNFVSVLGRSLAMDGLGFSAAAISSTGAAGGAVSLPLPLVVGWLSDRLGRRRFLVAAYLAGAVGLVLLARSAALWHFWVAVSLMYVQNALNSAVGSAFVADLVPAPRLGRGLALFTATTWIGGVVGFAATGYAVQGAGLATTLLAAAALPAAGAALLGLDRLVEKAPARREG
jgi:MFS family permease